VKAEKEMKVSPRENPASPGSRILKGAVVALVIQLTLLVGTLTGQLRRVDVGDRMPEFSATDVNGEAFAYKGGGQRVLVTAFLSADQKQSERAAAELQTIVAKLGAPAESLDFVVVADDANIKKYFAADEKKPLSDLRILLDAEYGLWGTVGVIATPTVIIVGKDDTIAWIKAGYGYDFAPSVEVHLRRALGMAGEEELEGLTRVRTLPHDTARAKAERHLKMAQMLEQKGRLESAVREIRKARELNPDSVEIVLKLGELYCRAGQGKQALETMSEVTTENRAERARIQLISGWAQRQMGNLKEAQALLLEATRLDPTSGRGLFELGKVYEAQGLKELAMETYHEALVQIFGDEARSDNSQQ
jgi:tetratricopeptide (TPR) repeat protein